MRQTATDRQRQGRNRAKEIQGTTYLSGVKARGESTSIDSMLRLVKDSELEETRRRGLSRVSTGPRGSIGSIGPGIEPSVMATSGVVGGRFEARRVTSTGGQNYRIVSYRRSVEFKVCRGERVF